MNKKVVVVEAWLTLREAAKLFIDKNITGAPVVDEEGKLVGVLSQTDLIRRQRERGADAESVPFYADEEGSRNFHIEEPDRTRVEQVMTPLVLSAVEDTPVEDLARMMLKRGVHRLIIMKNGKLRGIVSSMDLLRALLAGAERRAHA
jgi:CBS domain-containing protein